ncbi:MAG: hypothetical protein LN412_05035 [Candidatus Thermoplasmatota archaeon]|nr:hypothetical protein [Candidatus Thermoplasmatota archaeon]
MFQGLASPEENVERIENDKAMLRLMEDIPKDSYLLAPDYESLGAPKHRQFAYGNLSGAYGLKIPRLLIRSGGQVALLVGPYILRGADHGK